MSITYSEQVQMASTGRYDALSRVYNYSAQFNVPGLSCGFTVYYDGARTRYSIEWQNAMEKIQVVQGTIVLTYRGSNLLTADIASGTFPPSTAGSFTSASTGGLFSDIQVEIALQTGVSTPDALIGERARFAVVASSTLQAQVAANVCFSFPRSKQNLWADEDFLEQASPYLQSLLASSFREGTSTSTSQTASSSTLPAYTFAESDEETDKLEGGKKGKKPSGTKQQAAIPCKTVTIIDTAYSTYFAVLVWMQSRHIAFCPLLSSFLSGGSSTEAAVKARAAAVFELVKKNNALLPPPVSPKSVYRLAHLLELDDLSSLALTNLSSQLTPENAAYELYSDAATCYPAVRDVVLDYVVEHWDEVKEAKGTKEMEEKGSAGELDSGTAGTSMKLARRLAEAKKA